MEILIGKGIDSIQFGQAEAEVIKSLGKPDKVYETDDAKRLQFFQQQIEIAFEYKLGDRFGWIEVKNPDATLFGEKLIGEGIGKVLSITSAAISDAPEYEDYGSFETYFYETCWLELQFEFNRLRSINIGVLWIDNDTPNWPQQFSAHHTAR